MNVSKEKIVGLDENGIGEYLKSLGIDNFEIKFFPAWIKKANERETEKRARELLEILGMSARTDAKPDTLSGGEAQRVAVARALINQPEVIFADEPSGNLDSANAHELHQLFFTLREKFKQTFVIVTHNEALADMADRVIHMKDGSIIDYTDSHSAENG